MTFSWPHVDKFIREKYPSVSSLVRENWPFLAFVVLNVAGIFFHEPWRDEIQALLVAKAPLSLSELFSSVLHYECHPILWFLMLKIFSPFGVHPLGLQILNSLCAMGTAALFWWKFPLGTNVKRLLIFNYYFVYEYGIIARSYSLGIFLIFFYLAFFDSPKKNLRTGAFVALLLAIQVSIYSLIVAVSLFLSRFFLNFATKRKKSLFEALLVILSVVSVIFQVMPAADYGANTGVNSTLMWDQAVAVLSLAGEVFLFMPPVQLYPGMWPIQFPFSAPLIALRALFCFILLFYMGRLLYKRSSHLWWPFALAVLAILTFSYMRLVGSFRHMAHLIVILAAFYWLAQKQKLWELHKHTISILFFAGAWSALAAGIFYTADFMYPFSDAKAAAKFIGSDDKLIIGLPDFTMATISGFLDGREIYSLNAKRFASYVRWDKARLIPDFDVKAEVLAAMDKAQTDEAILVSSDPRFVDDFRQRFSGSILYISKACIVADECFLVLKVRRSYFEDKKPAVKKT